MSEFISILFAIVVGFTHAFEADHVVAVSTLVTKRNNTFQAIRDGIYWGLGHSSTVLIIGIIIIIFKSVISEQVFSYLEAIVGIMLIGLGILRIRKALNPPKETHIHKNQHSLAYGVGLVHGLAGSGAMVLLVMTEIQGTGLQMIYLILFCIGSILGMLVAAGIFSLPFSKKLSANINIQKALIFISAILCIALGGYIVYENLMG